MFKTFRRLQLFIVVALVGLITCNEQQPAVHDELLGTAPISSEIIISLLMLSLEGKLPTTGGPQPVPETPSPAGSGSGLTTDPGLDPTPNPVTTLEPTDIPTDAPTTTTAAPPTPPPTTTVITTTTTRAPTTMTTTAIPTTTTSAPTTTTLAPRNGSTTAVPPTAPPTTTAAATPVPLTTTKAPTPRPQTPVPPPATPSPPSTPQVDLRLIAQFFMPPSCLSGGVMIPVKQCFITSLMHCFSWITQANQVAFYQFTQLDAANSTNVTFFIVDAATQTLDVQSTQKIINIFSDQKNAALCFNDGLNSIRAASNDVPAPAPEQSISPVAVIFALLLVFAVLLAFFAAIYQKRKQVERTRDVQRAVNMLENYPAEELECVYTKQKREEELRAEEEARERALRAEELRKIREEEEIKRAEEERQREEQLQKEREANAPLMPHREGSDASTAEVEVDDVIVAPIVVHKITIDMDTL